MFIFTGSDTRCFTLAGLQKILTFHTGKFAVQYRTEINDLFARYMSGDPTLLTEIEANRESMSDLHEAFRRDQPFRHMTGTKRVHKKSSNGAAGAAGGEDSPDEDEGMVALKKFAGDQQKSLANQVAIMQKVDTFTPVLTGVVETIKADQVANAKKWETYEANQAKQQQLVEDLRSEVQQIHAGLDSMPQMMVQAFNIGMQTYQQMMEQGFQSERQFNRMAMNRERAEILQLRHITMTGFQTIQQVMMQQAGYIQQITAEKAQLEADLTKLRGHSISIGEVVCHVFGGYKKFVEEEMKEIGWRVYDHFVRSNQGAPLRGVKTSDYGSYTARIYYQCDWPVIEQIVRAYYNQH